MKKIFTLFIVIIGFITFLSGCNSTKSPTSAMHNRGVNNRNFVGY